MLIGIISLVTFGTGTLCCMIIVCSIFSKLNLYVYLFDFIDVSSVYYIFFFFFSSRRRHTRYWRDWSSDVCSSDLWLLSRSAQCRRDIEQSYATRTRPCANLASAPESPRNRRSARQPRQTTSGSSGREALPAAPAAPRSQQMRPAAC